MKLTSLFDGEWCANLTAVLARSIPNIQSIASSEVWALGLSPTPIVAAQVRISDSNRDFYFYTGPTLLFESIPKCFLIQENFDLHFKLDCRDEQEGEGSGI